MFRRTLTIHVLCNTQTLNCEAKRRVKANRDSSFNVDKETDNSLWVKTRMARPMIFVNSGQTDEVISEKSTDATRTDFAAQLLAPLPGADEQMEDGLTKTTQASSSTSNWPPMILTARHHDFSRQRR